MIISTGMRTDIPAFYSKWLVNRINAGFVYVRNPYNEHQITKYNLTPDVVDCICFCTKNPIPMLPYLEEIKKFNQFWFVTITAYDTDFEPYVPNKEDVISAFKTISGIVGPDGISWRYDPIFFSEKYNKQTHIEQFKKIAKALNGYTKCCVISFLDLYEKVTKNAPELHRPNKNEQMELVAELVKIAKENGMIIRTCCEDSALAKVGADVSGCQTKEVIEQATGIKLNPPNKKNARHICNCLLGQDIGAYNTCGHLCKYCYANSDKFTIINNMKLHNPNSPLLIGDVGEEDKITPAKQFSYIDKQMYIF